MYKTVEVLINNDGAELNNTLVEKFRKSRKTEKKSKANYLSPSWKQGLSWKTVGRYHIC